jgi:hypothetical protein
MERNNNWTVELYAFAHAPLFTGLAPVSLADAPALPATSSSSIAPTTVGVLEAYTILSADWKTSNGVYYHSHVSTTTFPRSFSCPFNVENSSITVPWVSGQVYALITPRDNTADAVTMVAMNATRQTCASGAYVDNVISCVACPGKVLLTFAAPVNQCPTAVAAPSRRSSCDLVQIVSGIPGKVTQADGIFVLQSSNYNNHPWYLSVDSTLALVRTVNQSEWHVLPYPLNGGSSRAMLGADGWSNTRGTLLLPDSAILVSSTATTTLGVRVVKVIQNQNDALNLAEMQIWSADATPVNLAGRAKCYSAPTVGYYFNANRSTGLQTFLTDNDLTTFSHSGDATTGIAYDMCVLDAVYAISAVTLFPRVNWGSRSRNLKLELWSDFVPTAPLMSQGNFTSTAYLGSLLYERTGDFSDFSGSGPVVCAADAAFAPVTLTSSASSNTGLVAGVLVGILMLLVLVAVLVLLWFKKHRPWVLQRLYNRALASANTHSITGHSSQPVKSMLSSGVDQINDLELSDNPLVALVSYVNKPS